MSLNMLRLLTVLLFAGVAGSCGGDPATEPGTVTIDGPAEQVVRSSAGGARLSGTVWVPAGSACNAADGVGSIGEHRLRWRNDARGLVRDIRLTWDCLASASAIPWQADVQLAIGANTIVVEMEDRERHGEARVEITWDPMVRPFPP